MINEREVLYSLKRDQIPAERAVFKARHRNGADACACCGKAEETTENVLMECNEMKPGFCLSASPNELLGFREYHENLNFTAIVNRKRRLVDWRRKSREKKTAKSSTNKVR